VWLEHLSSEKKPRSYQELFSLGQERLWGDLTVAPKYLKRRLSGIPSYDLYSSECLEDER